MNKLSDIKMGKKLALGLGGGVLQAVLLAGLALWAVSAINSAAGSAQQESRKMNVAMKVDAGLSELALQVGLSDLDVAQGHARRGMTEQFHDANQN